MAGVKGRSGNRKGNKVKTRTSLKKGQVLNPKGIGGRQKGTKNKPKNIVKIDELTITRVRQSRGIIALQFEEAFRGMFHLNREEFEKKLKLAKEPVRRKDKTMPPLTKAAKAMSMAEVMVYRYFDRLIKGGSADIDTTRMAFIFDVISGKNSPDIEHPKALLDRMREFINKIKIKGQDFDIGYSDIVRFMLGTSGLSVRELEVLAKFAKELLEIELSRLELIPRKNVKTQFKIWANHMIENFGSYPKLIARFQEGCKTDFKEKLPHGDYVDFPLVNIERTGEEIDITPPIPENGKPVKKAKKKVIKKKVAKKKSVRKRHVRKGPIGEKPVRKAAKKKVVKGKKKGEKSVRKRKK